MGPWGGQITLTQIVAAKDDGRQNRVLLCPDEGTVSVTGIDPSHRGLDS